MKHTVEQIWQRYDADEVRLSAPLSQRMLELSQLRPGMNALDLATGRGEPAIRACKAVAPGGKVVGIDTAASMLEMAQKRASSEGVTNLELIAANAESLEGVPDLQFDIVLTRWGLMYMNAPTAALRAAHALCHPGAKLVAALWAEPERVDYYTLPRIILNQPDLIKLPTSAQPLNEPGPFRYCDLARIEHDFQAGGWPVEHVEELYVDVMEAHSDQELIDWCRCFGLNRVLEHTTLQMQQQWERDLVAICRPRRSPQGVVRLGGVTRIVVCSRKSFYE